MKRKPNRAPAIILATIVGLLVAYPLSIGPAALLYTCSKSDRVERAFFTVYEPLGFLPGPMVSALEKWAEMWVRLAPD